MDDGSPALGVDFEIDAGASFGTLDRLEGAMGSAQASVLADARRIEQATSSMIDLAGATAEVTTFGNASSRALRDAARDMAQVERAGESMVRTLDRQNEAFGKTRQELRSMKADAAALAAEQKGMTELAGRIRTSESSLREKELGRDAARAAAVQEAAVQSLRGAIDPLYAAQRRLSDELESAARLYRNGAIGQAEYERASQSLATRLDGVQQAQARANRGLNDAVADGKLSASELSNVVAQLSDIGVSLAGGQNPFLVLIQQGSQLQGLAMQSGLGIGGLAKAIVGLAFVTTPAAAATAALVAAQTANTAASSASAVAGQRAAIAAAELAVAEEAATVAGLTDARAQQALSAARIEAARTAAIATQASARLTAAQEAEAAAAAAAAGSATRALAPMVVTGLAVGAALGVAAGAFALFQRSIDEGIDEKGMVASLGLTSKEIERLKDTSVDTGDVIKATFQVIGERVGFSLKGLKDSFGNAMDYMTSLGRSALSNIYANFVGTFRAIGAVVTGVFAGKGIGDIIKSAVGEWKGAKQEADAAMIDFGKDVTKRVAANKLTDLQKQAAEIKDGRPDKADKVDKHAASLAREAAAMEAQIRNLYSLADAYGVSGAAALIAEARVKAESAAIKKRGDIEAMVAQQVRLSIAERVKTSAQNSAALRDEATIQAAVNAEVAAGTVAARDAQQLLGDRMADLPLLAALEAARTLQGKEGVKAVEAAGKALDTQRAAQSRLNDERAKAQLIAMNQSNDRQLAVLREEFRLVGATDAVRTRSLARMRAEQEMEGKTGEAAAKYVRDQVAIADTQFQVRLATDAVNDSLVQQSLLLDAIATNAADAARGMADAFGEAGRALGDLGAIFANHIADQERLKTARDAQLATAAQMTEADKRAAAEQRANSLFAARNATAQVGFYGDMTAAAKGFFDEKSKGYAALSIAEKVFRGIEFALSVKAMAQDAIETGAKIATTVARTAVRATEAVVNAIASLPFPLNLAAGAATVAAIGSLGVSIASSFGGSSRNRLEKANDGSGSVLGDGKAQSESIKRAVDQLREVDTLTNGFAREMAASLKSIDSQIGGVASAIVRGGDINASAGIAEGFKSDSTGKLLQGIVTGGGLFSKVPIVGSIISGVGSLLGSLFGSSTSVIGSGLYGKSQTLGGILSGGFDAQTYSDVEKKKKFLGITTGKSYSTQYGNAAPELEGQFTLLLRSFATAIGAAAGPLGEATSAVEARLSGFVVNIGKIDLKGLTGEQIAEKLTGIFGKAADEMADAAFPGIARFQQVGEGAFETLVRVASTVEAVTVSLNQLGLASRTLGLDAKVGIAAQFDSVSAMSSAADSYFKAFYTPAEQNAARMSQLNGVFVRLGVTMPATIGAFRALVDAQDLTTAAGQSTYATLLQLAPAFADLKSAMDNAKSAADVLAEREGLQRRLLELDGNTAAIRALDLAKLDASNRALQQQIYAIEDAKAAADAANDLREAWSSVGDTIEDEVKRIRGLDSSAGGGSFATLLGQFNAANISARGSDGIDAAKSLPGLSQALLKAAAERATSRQELARIEAQTAASLEATQAAIAGRSAAAATAAILASSATAAAANQAPANNNAATATTIDELRQEIAAMRRENNAGHAATAGNTARAARVLEDVTAASGGDAIAVGNAA